ncbi:hypothetical protein RJT34_21952 [Clitoria ternatea]|uniref:TIR domain-containing protein n=1 Tax=Clitoria ternatea TaxID=43366 RepID=A0AAN9IV45_CLITE
MAYRVYLHDAGESIPTPDRFVPDLDYLLSEAGVITNLSTAFSEKTLEEIRSHLRQAVESSQCELALVVFSRNCTDSSRYLDVLQLIVDCHNDYGLVILPIFYGVDPCDVRNQTGDFGKALEELAEKRFAGRMVPDLLFRWGSILTQATRLPGWDFADRRCLRDRGLGSVLIVTTKEVNLLDLLKVDLVSKMKKMDENEALELFSWHAFRKASPRVDFRELSRNVIAYCEGLLLALEVLGSYLYERTKEEWESALSKLNRIPNHQVKEKLKISYNDLDDDEKNLFIDICFSTDKHRAYFKKKEQNNYGFDPQVGYIP